MALVEVKVPDIGDFNEVQIIELLVKPGDKVSAEQSLITVESDKASMEIPSSHAGVVKELKVKLGGKVKEGTVVLVLDVLDVLAEGAETASPSATTATPLVAPTPSPIPKPSPTASTASSALSVIEVLVPDIGDFDSVSVIELFVKVGDTVKVDQSLITVESDKASMEIPSSHAGVIKSLKVKLGDKVAKGSLLALVESASSSPSASPTASSTAPAPATSPATAPVSAPAAAVPPTAQAMPVAGVAMLAHEPLGSKGPLPHASPSVRRFARELGVPLAEVKGSGPRGRITQLDVQHFTQAVMAGDARTQAQVTKTVTSTGHAGEGFPGLLPWPKVDFAKFGPIVRKDMSRIKKISGANLHRNWVVIPHVTNHDDADITELEAFRVQLNKEHEKSGIKVTMLAFLIKASVSALKKFPDFNASLDGDQIVQKQYFHIGFAADTPNGLVVPVIKDADRKGVLQISQEMSELAKKARDGKLGPNEMSGGCFSISSLGGIGGRYFTPIINAPEVSILGVCKSAIEPRWDGKSFAPRLILPLSLSWDHRVIDGASAARFNAYLGQILADFRRVLL